MALSLKRIGVELILGVFVVVVMPTWAVFKIQTPIGYPSVELAVVLFFAWVIGVFIDAVLFLREEGNQ